MNPIDSIGVAQAQPGRIDGIRDRAIDPEPNLQNGKSFAEALTAAAGDHDLRLSSHALRRIEQRGIGLGAPELDRLNGAFAQLAGKGGRQSLVLVDQVAYVVHVPSKTVVTAVAQDERNDANVFTRIDSVVIA